MNIGKLIKTGLAIYGGTVLAKKLGRYIFVKNKDKIIDWTKKKIQVACDKAIDDIFHCEEKNAAYSFRSSDVCFLTADDAFEASRKMLDVVKTYAFASVADLKEFVGIAPDFIDSQYGWKDPDPFKTVGIERKASGLTTSGYMYYLVLPSPEKKGTM